MQNDLCPNDSKFFVCFVSLCLIISWAVKQPRCQLKDKGLGHDSCYYYSCQWQYRNVSTSHLIPGVPELPHGCMYEGRWFTEGSAVTTREACLRCACARGALSCRRRACAALPDPPPRRCHVLHKKGSCCPELHCPGEIDNISRPSRILNTTNLND